MSSVSGDAEEWIRYLSDPPSFSYITEPGTPGSFALSGGDSLCTQLKARAKRVRSQNWSPDEKGAYLEAKLEALHTVKGKDWEFVSHRLRDKYGFIRSPKNCEDLWGTLRKDYRAIAGHETSVPGDPHTSNVSWVSYWEMDEDARSKKKLPRSFPLNWYETMETILAAQEKRSQSSANPIRTIASNVMCSGRKSSTGVVLEYVTVEPGQLFELCIAPFVKREVEEEVNVSLRSLPCLRSASGDTLTKQDELLTLVAPRVKQQVEGAVIYALQILALSGFSFESEADPVASLAPFVRERIKDALDSAVQPVSSALQTIAQKERDVQEQLRAIEEKRRALDLEEMKIKRQRVSPAHQSSLKTKSSHKSQGPRGKDSCAERVIPKFQGLNLAGDRHEVVLQKDE